MSGGAGDDTLIGGDGNDTYAFTGSGALGSDAITELNAGGTDILDFSGLTLGGGSSGVTANLTSGTGSINNTVTLTLAFDPYIENVTGTAKIDTLTGNSQSNLLVGGSGSDTLTGNDGGDWLDGGAGSDTVDGGAGNDAIYVFDQTADTIDGGADSDLLWTENSSNSLSNVETTDVPLSVAGDATVYRNTSYELDLTAANFSPITVTAWTIHWGDGSDTNQPGQPTQLTHTYTTDGDYNVTVSVSLSDGSTAEFSGPTVHVFGQLLWDPNHTGGTSLGGSGSWSGSNNWWDGQNNVSWVNGAEAHFSGTAGTVTLSSGVTVAAIGFESDGYTVSGNTITLSGTGTMIFASQSATISSAVVVATGQQWQVASSEVLTVSGVVSGSGGLAKSGAGNLILSSQGTYTGGTLIKEGTLQLGTNNALPTNDTVTFGSSNTSGTLELNGFNQQVAGLAVASGATAANQTIGNSSTTADATLTFNGASGPAATFGGTIKDKITGSGTHKTKLTVSGGTITLSGSSTYTGETTINGGTVEFASGGLGSGDINFGGNATLQWASGNTSDISGRLFVDLNFNATLDLGSNNVTFASNSFNYGSFTKAGTGTLSVVAVLQSTYGSLTISSGAVQIGTGGTAGSLLFGSIINNGALVSNHSDTFEIGAVISGAGEVRQIGTGLLFLSDGANSYTGGTELHAGTLTFAEDALGPSGPITFVDDAILQWYQFGLTYVNQDISSRLVIENGVIATLNTNFNDVMLATAFGGSSTSSLIKTGEGTLTFGDTNTYTGTTTINNGTLLFEEEANIGSTSGIILNGDAHVIFDDGIAFSSSGTLTLNDSSQIFIVGNETLSGTGQIVLNNALNKVYAQGVDGSTPANLTVGSNVKIRGLGTIDGFYSGDELLNQGTISAQNGTLTIDLPYTNEGSIGAYGTAILAVDGRQIKGIRTAMSATELNLYWSGIDSGAATYVVQKSTDGTNYSTVETVTASDKTYLFKQLNRNTSYNLRMTATDSNGGKEFYDSGALSTLDIPDATGWYRVEIGNNTNLGTESFAEFAPDVQFPPGFNCGGSTWGAMWDALSGLPGMLPNGSVPMPDGSGNVFIWGWNMPGGGKAFTFDGQRPPGAISAPHIFGLFTQALALGLAALFSGDPVRYSDGAVDYSATDLESTSLGESFTHTRSWSGSGSWSADQRNGTGWIDNSLPIIQQSNNGRTISVIRGAINVQTFQLSGGQYVPTSYVTDSLVHDTGNDEFVWTDSSGNEIRFYDFSGSAPTGRAGSFKVIKDAGGLETEVTAWTSDGAIQEVRRFDAADSAVESWLYSYLGSSNPNEGLLSSVQFRQTDGSSGWNVVRKVVYDYYEESDSYGNLGDLKTASVLDASDNVLDTDYYRYYTPSDTGGFVHGLKYAFDSKSYARIYAALGDPTLLSDSQVAPFAEQYFEYDSTRRATRHDVLGAAGAPADSIGTYTYQYFSNSDFSTDPNAWAFKTVETLPDGNINTIYMNSDGALILKDFAVVEDLVNPELSDGHWLTYCEYDAQGRLIFEAMPSAVLDYDLTEGELIVTLADNSGLINLTEYYTSTTATDTTAGGVLGYLKNTKVQQGELGTPILQETRDYFSITDDGRTNVVLATNTAYRNTNGTGGATVSYAYTWHADTVAVESVTESMPVVSTSQNGSGSADSDEVFYDIYGRPIWTKDAAGYINYTEYDSLTGAAVKTIADVDTAETGDFTDLPSGWTTPSGGGLHLITTMEVDALGRTTKLTDAVGNVTYIVYKDANHEIRTYRGWNETTDNATGTIGVYREDRAGNYTDKLTYIWGDEEGVPVDLEGRPTGAESLADSDAIIQSFSRELFNSAGQLIAVRFYTNLDGVTYGTSRNLGASGTNYLESSTQYTDHGSVAAIVDSTGTRREWFYDGMNRLTQVWIGTDAIPTTDYNEDSVTDVEDFRWWVEQNPTAVVGPSGTSMFKSSVTVYDNDEAGGDSNITELRRYYGSGTGENYETNYEYDWRNRQIGVLGPDGVAKLDTLDNLGRTTESQSYANSSFVSGAIDEGDLRAQTQMFYDEQGRLFESRVFEVTVNPSTGAGTAADYLARDIWYDPRGLVAKSVTGAGAFEKFAYDGAGRLTASYLSYDSDEVQTDYDAALDVDGDTVIEQTENWYDANGSVIATVMYERLPDDSSSTGALTAANSYASATASWYDAIDRVTHQVDFGRQDALAEEDTDFFDETGDLIDVNSNGVPDIVESAPPAPNTSDDYLVTQTIYEPRLSDAGAIVDVIDNLGHISETQFDLLGRVIRMIENYDDGIVDDADIDSDKTTENEFDSFGRLVTFTAVNPKGDGNGIQYQRTKYLYESAENASWQTGVVSPDSTDVLSQNGTTKVWSITTDNDDHVSHTYDWIGRKTTSTDQRGVIHTYGYDTAGRLSSDTATDLGLSGQNVDGTIRRIGYQYDDLGRRKQVTSYSDTSGTTVVNEVQYAYDGWGNLIEEWQEHDGAVNTSTSTSTQYVYDDGASSGVAKYVRLTDIIYPNGRDVVYDYGSSGSTDDVLSRISSIGDGTDNYASYEYLGAGRIVSEDYEEPEVKLDYAANNFSALDRFGRILDQVWSDYGSSPSTLDEYNYSFDRLGNRTARENGLENSLSQVFDYDNLNQLISAERDNGYTQTWDLDGLGNWSSFDDDGTVQTRGTNAANEITSISGGPAAPAYDRAGNMITTPKPGDESTGMTVTYDAWNRVVAVDDGTTTVTYEYDGQGRLIERTVDSESEHFYHSGEQVIETRLPDSEEELETDKQYIWSQRYVDAPILRDSYSGGVLQTGERLYYLNDATYNVTAVVNASGVVQERYDYDAYGKATVYDANWANPALISSLGNNLLFSGQIRDADTGLQHSRARWYSVSVGGFLSRDSAGFSAGDENLYRYVSSNPTNYVDPSGHLLQIAGNVLNILGGLSLMALGAMAMMGSGGLGFGLGLGAALKGLDMALTRIRGLATGTSPDSFTSEFMQSLGVSQDVANMLDMALELLLTAGASSAKNGTTLAHKVRNFLADESGALRVPRNVDGGATTVKNALTQAEKYLGPGYREIDAGVFRSADNLRQFRMTNADLTDPRLGPHVHFESIGPNGRTITQNSHVLLLDP